MKHTSLVSSLSGQAEHDAVEPVRAVEVPVAEPLPETIGYLTNVYPSVSHSFIRREILALEQQGITVARFSIRRSLEPLPDPEDQRERSRTLVLLDAGVTALIIAVLRRAVMGPRRFARAVLTMLALRRAAGGGGLRHLAYLAEAALLVRMAEQRGIRHLHVHFGTNPAAVALLAKTLGSLRYSMTVHGPEEFDAPIALSLPQKIAEAAFVAAISSHGRGQVMRWSRREDWSKVAVVRCGLDRQAFESPPRGASSSTLVCVARLDRQKGLCVLLDAVARVASVADLRVRIIGDGPMRAELVANIARLGIGDRVCLVGWKSAAAIREELLAARALILPSFAEGLPVVLMEAMALRRPVIATWIAGVPELVDASCGWLVPAGSAQALANAIVAVLEASEASLVARGAAGQAIVRARHDAMRNAAQLATLFSDARWGRPIERAEAA